MSMEEKFLKTFKQEHQVILDNLLKLRGAVQAGDSAEAERLVNTLDDVMGPHFKIEEVSLYPMLKDYLGEENVRKLLKEHAGAVEAMHALKKNAGKTDWLKANGKDVMKTMQGMFMHVTSCDGLSIIIERFPQSKKLELAAKLDEVYAKKEPLTVWRKTPGEYAKI
ncbi:MAG: hemerythrin domain-containing protein [Thermoprotei archaeon]